MYCDKNITVKAGDENKLNLVISVSKDEEEILKNLEYYKIAENVKNAFNITRANLEEETRYLNLSKENIQAYNMILPYILEQNPMKSLYMNKLKYREYKQSDLWKYGISGDLPIILVQTNSVNDVYVVKELLKVHENLRAKGILADLVILDYEKNVYERYVRDQIIQEIWSLQIGYLQNVSSGIFLLNAGEIEDEDLLKFRANILINASKGSLIEAIKEQEEEYISYLAKGRNELN